ncbi:MAG: hypothetical protein AAF577_12560 [Pseudomonadota bacterium]
MRQGIARRLSHFFADRSGAVALDWIAMGTIVLILGIATAGSLGDDVEMVQSSMNTLMDHLPGGEAADTLEE